MSKMTRLEANRKLIAKLAAIVEMQPDWRFHQILQNFDITSRGCDQFYEESTETLANLQAYLNASEFYPELKEPEVKA